MDLGLGGDLQLTPVFHPTVKRDVSLWGRREAAPAGPEGAGLAATAVAKGASKQSAQCPALLGSGAPSGLGLSGRTAQACHARASDPSGGRGRPSPSCRGPGPCPGVPGRAPVREGTAERRRAAPFTSLPARQTRVARCSASAPRTPAPHLAASPARPGSSPQPRASRLPQPRRLPRLNTSPGIRPRG